MNNNKIPVLIWLYHKDKWNYKLSKLVDCKDLVYPVMAYKQLLLIYVMKKQKNEKNYNQIQKSMKSGFYTTIHYIKNQKKHRKLNRKNKIDY